jgi:hypothetical protein
MNWVYGTFRVKDYDAQLCEGGAVREGGGWSTCFEYYGLGGLYSGRFYGAPFLVI